MGVQLVTTTQALNRNQQIMNGSYIIYLKTFDEQKGTTHMYLIQHYNYCKTTVTEYLLTKDSRDKRMLPFNLCEILTSNTEITSLRRNNFRKYNMKT